MSVFLFFQLAGCSFKQHAFNSLAEDLSRGHVEQVLVEVEKSSYPDRDYVQYQLNIGLLRAYSGDFPGAIEELQKAKQVIAALQAKSVSENVGAVAVNETLRSYSSTPSERMMLQQLLIIAYLLEGDIGGARVEVLQGQVIEQSLPMNSGLSGMVASSHYLAGLVYQINGEPDNAMISYRRALQVMNKSGIKPPKALSDGLLRASLRLGLDDEHRQLVEQFDYQLAPISRESAELVVLYWQGVVSHKSQHFITVYVPSLEHNVSLALPYYPSPPASSRRLAYNLDGKQYKTEILDNIETLARDDLAADSAAIYAAALARMVTKHQAIKEAQKNDSSGFAAAILNIASVVSEVADVRSWNMLPSAVQVQRLDIDAGEYTLAQPKEAGGLQINKVELADPDDVQHPTIVETQEDTILVDKGQTLFIFYPSPADQVFSIVEPL
ncbi:hypothetical protein [Sinobacterium norvegicum]|uniref:hypothetical protein n=1 Tax=Sinobacterium norvegicum TaxID=1641715 RepID=UPI001F2C36FA|nr:hypothetical protein [Sinobacterium norvegicum]